MESERIPEDVTAAAIQAALTKFMTGDPQWEAVVDVCARAIMAERIAATERAAKIVQQHFASRTAKQIVAAIRGNS